MSGATLTLDTSLKVGANQVVGAQQSAIVNLNSGTLILLSDVITFLATVQTTTNTLLAELRTHGLIAT